mmetsp:Transcript_22206/g.55277  ORF Transcript_22206/g.55277 Transcript_22206/m.55277 type:complete len:291 (+) Transcript_22206:778-1650(+)
MPFSSDSIFSSAACNWSRRLLISLSFCPMSKRVSIVSDAERCRASASFCVVSACISADVGMGGGIGGGVAVDPGGIGMGGSCRTGWPLLCAFFRSMSSNIARISSLTLSIWNLPSDPSLTPPCCCMLLGGEISIAYQNCCSRDTKPSAPVLNRLLPPPAAGSAAPAGAAPPLLIGSARPAREPRRESMAGMSEGAEALSFLALESFASGLGIESAHLAMASEHHGCSLTCWMVSRFRGSSTINLEIRSRASGEMFLHFSSGLKVNLPLTTCLSSWSTSFALKGIVFDSIT